MFGASILLKLQMIISGIELNGVDLKNTGGPNLAT
jgi:hypothetical protein